MSARDVPHIVLISKTTQTRMPIHCIATQIIMPVYFSKYSSLLFFININMHKIIGNALLVSLSLSFFYYFPCPPTGQCIINANVTIAKKKCTRTRKNDNLVTISDSKSGKE